MNQQAKILEHRKCAIQCTTRHPRLYGQQHRKPGSTEEDCCCIRGMKLEWMEQGMFVPIPEENSYTSFDSSKKCTLRKFTKLSNWIKICLILFYLSWTANLTKSFGFLAKAIIIGNGNRRTKDVLVNSNPISLNIFSSALLNKADLIIIWKNC